MGTGNTTTGALPSSLPLSRQDGEAVTTPTTCCSPAPAAAAATDLRENTDNYATIIFDNDREDSAFKTINLIGQGTREDKDELMNILT